MTRFYRIDHHGTPRFVVDNGGGWQLVEGDIFGDWKAGAAVAPNGHRLLAPLVPSKIVAIGRNYKDHAAELGNPLPAEPMIFLKPPSAMIGPDEPIVIPAGVGRVDHEAELGVVIGTRARHVKAQDASRYVFGLTCVNDVTARELQKKDIQFTRAKGFDTFAPIGPCIVTGLDYTRRMACSSKATSTASVGRRGRPRADFPDRPAHRLRFGGHDAPARAISSPRARRPASGRCRPAIGYDQGGGSGSSPTR